MIWDVKTFDYSKVESTRNQPKPVGNPAGRKKNVTYKDITCAFDIETTPIEDIEQSVMYIWQFQWGHEDTIIGRTWDEFRLFIKRIEDQLNEGEYIVVYVHNLSYEFQWLRDIFEFEEEDVFAVESRKVLKCIGDNHIEFRCSYLHSNMNLDTYLKQMKAPHQKLELNYRKKRWPWTPLSKKELDYCINDVIGLVEAIDIEMAHDNDNLYTIPLTSTGYVRRDAKKAMRTISHYRIKDVLPDINIYEELLESFRGGNTHANRYYAGRVIDNVKSFDRSSSYPDVICNCEFPIKPFTKTEEQSMDRLLELIYKRNKPVLFRVSINNIRLIDNMVGCPYLSRDKCRNVINGLFDNGRIIRADHLETTINDIDFKIIIEQYEWDGFTPYDIYYSTYGKLPEALIDCTIGYYKKKTELKNVEGMDLIYTKSKNKLNSIYGMMAQRAARESIRFIDGEFIEDNKPLEDLLIKANRKAFLAYQWGCWTTAWARYRLEEGIKLVGDGFVYCDTDSVKYIGYIDWSKYNKQRIKDSKASGAFATDPKGITHYMGVYEPDGEYEKFATLGAKKYVLIEDGKLKITVAGVVKDKGAKELEKHGGIKAFKEGFIFREAGGTESVYNDKPPMRKYKVEGHEVEIISNVYIRDSTYTVNMTEEYKNILQDAKTYAEIVKGLEYDLKYES